MGKSSFEGECLWPILFDLNGVHREDIVPRDGQRDEGGIYL